MIPRPTHALSKLADSGIRRWGSLLPCHTCDSKRGNTLLIQEDRQRSHAYLPLPNLKFYSSAHGRHLCISQVHDGGYSRRVTYVSRCRHRETANTIPRQKAHRIRRLYHRRRRCLLRGAFCHSRPRACRRRDSCHPEYGVRGSNNVQNTMTFHAPPPTSCKRPWLTH